MATRQRSSESRQLKASESMEEFETPITSRGATDTVAIRRARNRLAARKSRQKRAEKNEELVEQVARLEEQVKYWRSVALQNAQGVEPSEERAPVAVNARTESPEEGLEEEEERLGKELEYLSRKNRVMDLRRQVAEARRQSESAGEERDIGNSRTMTAKGYPQSTSIRSSEDDEQKPEVSSKRRRVKGPTPNSTDPKPYHGSTSTEYLAFTRACEHIFEGRPVDFRRNEAKISYAVEFLPKDLEAAWRRANSKHEHTWATFKNFLLDELEPSSSNISRSYYNARQGRDQAVGDFITYVYGLEDQMEPFTDAQRRDHLLYSLRPEIIDAIREGPQQPHTRSELVDLAIAIEDRIKYPKPSSAQSHANGRSGDNANRSANKAGTVIPKSR